MGVYGSNFYLTPNIDRLAKSGMLFTQAYSAAANCAPSRACMLTGFQPTHHGIYTVGNSARGDSRDRKLIPVVNEEVLADSFFTIAEMLRTKGYLCASMGKWHIGDDPLTQGFDINVAGSKKGHPSTYFSPYEMANLGDGPNGEFLTDRLTAEAINFLYEHHQDKFFLYLPYYAVHTPLMAKKEKIEKYQTRISGIDQKNPVYASMIESVDEGIGRLISAIEDLNLRDKTFIILTSDNGGICHVSSQKPLRGGKGSYYEGGIRVPLIFVWPDQIKAGTISNEIVSNLDFFPTFVDLVKADQHFKEGKDGISLMPVLLQEAKLPERPMFWHFPIYLESYAGIEDEARDTLFRTRPGTVLRLGDWKLHEYFENDEFELFHLSLDPSEQRNLVEIYPDMADSLYHIMNSWRLTNNAPVPTELNPEYQVDH